MSKRHYVTTQAKSRAEYWYNLFGTDRLPVLAPMPRPIPSDCGRDTFVYDLLLRQLTQPQRDALSSYTAKVTGQSYEIVKRHHDDPRTTLRIPAVGCQVETIYEDETAVNNRPFFVGLLQAVRAARHFRMA